MGIFMDLTKAFDLVNHDILLKKLEKYGIRGAPLSLITTYLRNRQQYVTVNNITSSERITNSGIP